jgi:hypothetical protein
MDTSPAAVRFLAPANSSARSAAADPTTGTKILLTIPFPLFHPGPEV